MKQHTRSPQLRFARNLELSEESTLRSVVKAISWRVVGTSAAIIIAFVVTGSLTVASTIGILHMISNTILYFLHERVWNRIRWGRR
jgi:uncharacterized membrane protein